MAMREIVHLGNPILRKKARKVKDFDRALHQLLDDMFETMTQGEGIGLAAPQVGVEKRVIVVSLPDDEQSVEAYGEQAGVLYEVVNPEIVKASREMVDGVEACLSIPGYLGNVERHQAVTVRGQGRYGKPIRIKAYDWLARVFQHEIDHLDGVLFIDCASEVWKVGELPPSEREKASAEPDEAPVVDPARI